MLKRKSSFYLSSRKNRVYIILLVFLVIVLFHTILSIKSIIPALVKLTIRYTWSHDSNDTFIPSSYVCDKNGPPNNHSSILYNYCSKVPVPIDDWKRAQNYTESDVGFIIFTAATFYRTRATAVRDTWLSRVTHKYFLGGKPYPWLPAKVIEGAGDDKLSNMKKVFYSLQIIYNEQKNSSNPHKWYYLAGCDTYVNVPHVLKRLDPYDYRQPFFIGGHAGREVCRDGRKQKSKIDFPSGGAGFFLSSTLVELLIPHLNHYVENVWARNFNRCSECSDVALTCLIHKLGIHLTKMPGFWNNDPVTTFNRRGQIEFHSDPEPNTYHYVQPAEMYDIDEFYAFQHVDRLVNDRNWKELTEYTRLFIASHYEVLRLKRSECTLPPITNKTR